MTTAGPALTTARHIVRRGGEATFAVPTEFVGHSAGFRRWAVVDEATPAVHTGFGICRLDPGGSVATHLQSFEESVYVLDGEVQFQTSDGVFRLRPGDYGLVPVGVPHAWLNSAADTARWVEMDAPQPRARHGYDTFFTGDVARTGTPYPLPSYLPPPSGEGRGGGSSVDVRDPRTRFFGHIEPANMDVKRQTQDQLAVSASMRTALLVYSGITVKMMVDPDLGAQLSTMFVVQYQPNGVAGSHDHPFEETYSILEGETDATFDGERYRLAPGDVAFAGVGCVHGFSNPAATPVRWLETQAPQPPARHSYRFARDWEYLRARTAGAGE